jgi:DnaJ-class molecular chaperone
MDNKTEVIIKECIECKRLFKPYQTDIPCHQCGGDGYVEDDDDYRGSAFKTCWQCKGNGELIITEVHFCDWDCREQHFENFND